MLNLRAAQRSEGGNGKSRSPIAIAIPTARASEFRSKKHLWSVFCNTQYREIKLIRSPALDSVVIAVSGSPLIAKEDTIRVEHGDNLEDEVLPEAASDVMRRHKKVNQALTKKNNFHPGCHCKTIFTLIVIAKQF